MQKRSRAAVAATLLALAGVAPALASGSYSNRAPRPPADAGAMKLDRDKYHLGQKIYQGEAALPERMEDQVQGQKERLKALQSKLPSEVGVKKDLVMLAGKLTPQQLDALEYYVAHRFSPMAKK